jgi:hypothetical protein
MRWVQTHHLEGYSDQTGHCSVMDVLGTHEHNVYVYADHQHKRPIRVLGIRVLNEGREIATTKMLAKPLVSPGASFTQIHPVTEIIGMEMVIRSIYLVMDLNTTQSRTFIWL